MIDENTLDKLADIIRDTWPQLYRPMKQPYNNETVPPSKHAYCDIIFK